MYYNLNVDAQTRKLFEGINVNIELLLKESGIPHRTAKGDKYQLTADQYKAMSKAMDKYIDINYVLAFSVVGDMANFIPEFFAGLCAEDGITCINRVAKFKRIVAPVIMSVEEKDETTEVSFHYNDGEAMPRVMLTNAQLTILSIIRKGTGVETVSPLAVSSPYEYPEVVIDYMNIQPVISETNTLVFSNEDLKRPFITENNNMWEYLEGELNQRLKEIEMDQSFAASIRRTLFEMIPGGVSDAERISHELGVSKRTLQRKLKEEGTTFNEQLNHTRELLVRNYLTMDMTLEEIALLVNYADVKSLSRAFRTWTGLSVTEYRKKIG